MLLTMRYLMRTIACAIISSSGSADEFLQSWLAAETHHNLRCEAKVRVSFFGDLYINSTRMSESSHIFKNVEHILNASDANVVNLEGAITTATARAFPKNKFALKNPLWLPRALDEHNIRFLTLANNHIMDFGAAGLNQTVELLRRHNLEFSGAGRNLESASKPMVITKNGIKIALLSFSTTLPKESWASQVSEGIAYPNLDLVRKSIEQAKRSHDFVVVSYHWGKEASYELRHHQKELAQHSAKWGASLIYGHHSHLAQPIALHNETPTYFSLGNFIFTTYTKIPVLSLGLHATFCKQTTKEGQTANFLVKTFVSPINTMNYETLFFTKPHDLLSFRKVVEPYWSQKLFPSDTLFALPYPNSLVRFDALMNPLYALR